MAATASPDRILRELAEMWVSLGGQKNGESAQGVLRACTMTLVVMADMADDSAALGETLAAIMPEHPARAIVVRLQMAADAPLAARVFSQCWMPFGQRRQICCEQVEITAGERALGELPALISPLAVPDLPLMLWCRSPRLARLPEFARLAALAHKVIVDSARLGAAREVLPRLAAAQAAGTRVADLAWTRLTRWREVISRLFDNRDSLARLPGLTRCAVGYGGDAPPAAAWYMAAWLADSLRSAGLAVAPQLERDPQASAEALVRVTLEGPAGAPRVALELKDGGFTVTSDGVSRCTALPAAGDYPALREELSIVRRDAIFERTLSSAAQLALSF